MVNRQKASGICSSSHKSQESRKMPVGLFEPFSSGDLAQIGDHQSTVKGIELHGYVMKVLPLHNASHGICI
ncbi:hypothetical protein [Phyllobacterium sp. 22229]|uniref:hypothetical protein n=1 Tax=Phyllobacterium sp. 22229 TaxID=3453895 RepID=UPI003F856DD8